MSIYIGTSLETGGGFYIGASAPEPPGVGNNYFVNPSTGNDSNDGLSVGNPKLTIEGASAAARTAGGGGHVIELADGTYSDALDAITYTQIATGTSSDWNIYKAANPGSVIITQNLAVSKGGAPIGAIFVEFHGIEWQNNLNKSLDYVGMFKFFNCAINGGPLNDLNQMAFSTANCADGLLEDCWSYGGGGRYKFLIYTSLRMVLRRCVARNDGGWNTAGTNNSDPEASIIFYGSSGAIQNCIAVDSVYESTGTGGKLGGIVLNNNSGDVGGVTEIDGTIVLNIDASAYSMEGDGSTISGTTYSNLAALGVTQNGVTLNSSGITEASYINCIFDGSDIDGYADYSGISNDSVTRSIVANNVSEPLRGVGTEDFNNVYNNGGTASGANNETYNPRTNGSLYPVRRESGSQLETDDIGATIINRIGVSGTLFGETGYDTLTTEALWPFPNEDLILTNFRSVALNAPSGIVSGDRGFALTGATSIDGSPQTLTKYIWEQFGNEIPAEILGTNALISGPATLASTVSVEKVASGSLVADVASVSSTAVLTREASGSIVADVGVLNSTAALVKEVTGSIVSGEATLSSTAELIKEASGALVSDIATLNSTVSLVREALGAVVAGPAVLNSTIVPPVGSGGVPVIESQTTATTDGIANSTISLSMPAGLAANDLIYIIVSNENDNLFDFDSITTPDEYNLISHANNSNDVQIAVYWRLATGSETWPLVINPLGADFTVGWCLRISGVNTSAPINQQGTPAIGFGALGTLPEVTTDAANCLVIAQLGRDGSDFSVNPSAFNGTGWTATEELADPLDSTGGVYACWGQKDLATAGASVDCGWTSVGEDGAAGMQIAIAGIVGGADEITVDTGSLVSDVATLSSTADVIREAAGSLVSDIATLSSISEVTRNVSGNLVADVATINSTAQLSRIATGSLIAAPAVLEGSAVVGNNNVVTGAIVAAPASLSSTTEKTNNLTGNIVAGLGVLNGFPNVVGNLTASGALIAQPATLNSSAQLIKNVSGNLVAGTAALSSNVIVGAIATGAVVAGEGVLNSTVVLTKEVTGNIVSGPASLSSSSQQSVYATGNLVAGNAIINEGIYDGIIPGISISVHISVLVNKSVSITKLITKKSNLG